MKLGWRDRHRFAGAPGEKNWDGKPITCVHCQMPESNWRHDLSELDLTDRSAQIAGEHPDRDDELAARRAAKAAQPKPPTGQRPPRPVRRRRRRR